MDWEDLKSASNAPHVETQKTDKEEYKKRLLKAMSGSGDAGVADAVASKSNVVNDIARMICSVQGQYELSKKEYASLPKSVRNSFTFAANSLYEDISGGKITYQKLLDSYAALLTEEKYRKFNCSAVTIAADLAKHATKKEIKEDWKGDFLEQRKKIYGF